MQEIRPKQVLSYVFLPGILPRAKSLFGSGFGYLAFMMANIFQATRLLPPNHPYVSPTNIGKYSLFAVFAQARNNLVFDFKHLDQIVVFFTLILGFILLVIQFLLLFVGMVIRPSFAAAGAPPFAGMFTTPDPTKDLAFTLLDKVFGVPEFFNSEYAPTAGPLPFHQALHALFEFYSYALLIVAVIIVLYYVMVIVAETAQTGTPFGKRFNHLWAPIRLVVALGLLLPINYGLNSGQYIVLMAAKMGSGFATNGWNLFNSSLTNALGVTDGTLYARAKVPDTWPLVKFVNLAAACRESYRRLGVTDINAYIIKNPGESQVIAATEYQTALEFYNHGNVIVRFGKKDPVEFKGETGHVKPYCGEIVFNTTVTNDVGANVGPYAVQNAYFIETMLLWEEFAQAFGVIMSYRSLPNKTAGCTWTSAGYFGPVACNSQEGILASSIATMRVEEQSSGYEEPVTQARTAMAAAGGLAVPQELLDRGWGGAGIWYNRIAEINGAFFGAVSYLPVPSLLPLPMQQIMAANKAANQNVNPKDMFTPNLSDGSAIKFDDKRDALVAEVLYQSYQKLGTDDTYLQSDTTAKENLFRDTINLLFGLNGLFTMRENTDIHPLAQLVGLGKGIVDSSIRNMFAATIFAAGGGAFKAFGNNGALEAVAGIGTGIFTTLTTIGLTIGFILYYVLPFLPFMYFFFAVGNWVKTIFEAMVGVPLWALAHLRIDGHGLPGDSAMGGYFLILEIFLRPILTVFGLIGALIIFSAVVKVLNEIFTLVTANLAGFDNNPCQVTAIAGDCARLGTTAVGQPSNNTMSNPANTVMQEVLSFKRDTIDEFFFTIIYTVIVYMLATSSFKLIDQIPATILRWIGSGERSFVDGDKERDLTGEMTRYTAFGGFSMTSNLTQGIVGAASKVGEGVAGAGKGLVPGGGSNVAGQGRGSPPGTGQGGSNSGGTP